MTQEEATELRNRITRSGWSWAGDPVLNTNSMWVVGYQLAGETIGSQAFARDREIHSVADEEKFVRDLEESIGLGRLSFLD